MQSHIIEHLNGLLKNRLTAINQYFLHARILKHSGDLNLADHEYKLSIEAMRQADLLVELVLSRGGAPNLQTLDRMMVGHTADEILSNDLRLIDIGHARINSLMYRVEAAGDDEISDLLRKIRKGLWEHADYIHGYSAKADGPAPPYQERMRAQA